MAVNKVIYSGRTLIDLSSDTLSSASQLRKGVTAHTKAGNVISGTAPSVIQATNKSVSASSWRSNTTYADYPYRASISISGVTTSYTPYVSFSDADAESGILSQKAQTYSGGVYIYASEKPSATVTINKIECVEG